MFARDTAEGEITRKHNIRLLVLLEQEEDERKNEKARTEKRRVRRVSSNRSKTTSSTVSPRRTEGATTEARTSALPGRKDSLSYR